MRRAAVVVVVGVLVLASGAPAQEDDPHLWLEDVEGEKPLAWVAQRNAACEGELAGSESFAALGSRLLSIYDSDEKIPYVQRIGEHLYNLWRDGEAVRGRWRRTTLEEFRRKSPRWETVLDLDRLAEEEGENWVWKGVEDVLEPADDLCLIALSRGGGDAAVIREFDLGRKAFVEDGFVLPEAKSNVSWRNRDTLLVATEFGAGSTTTSGYPRIVKEWVRGTPLDEARPLFEGEADDVSVGGSFDYNRGSSWLLVWRSPGFYTHRLFLLDEDRTELDKPADADLDPFGSHLLIRLRSDWKVGERTYRQGSLLAILSEDFLAGRRDFDVLFEPGERTSLAGYATTRTRVVLNELDNVRSRLSVASYEGGKWTKKVLPGLPTGTLRARAYDEEESDLFWLTATDYLEPPSLHLVDARTGTVERLKSLPPFFDASGSVVEQREATSADGTKVPYFLVRPAEMKFDGSAPTLLYGYGGFEIEILPAYSATTGAAWIEGGGVYAVANIRGGGEFGPRWHQAALRENRQRAYDDFIAVAEDLVARKVTSPAHLGISGGSNGGLLVGNVFVQRPDLFAAVVCSVPLLDMKRYHRLLAGASWMAEYGDPDRPEDWAYLEGYSPYHQVRKGVDYPRVLFTTSTRDDRVHPAHARKMVARMLEQEHDCLYYENTEGGHGGAANNEQSAHLGALKFTFLWNELR